MCIGNNHCSVVGDESSDTPSEGGAFEEDDDIDVLSNVGSISELLERTQGDLGEAIRRGQGSGPHTTGTYRVNTLTKNIIES